MYLKQKLKQKINLALIFQACFFAVFSEPARGWYSTQKDNRRECIGENRKVRRMLRSIDQTCALLAVSRSTVYRLIESGKLRRVYVRGVPRITQESLSELVGEQNG